MGRGELCCFFDILFIHTLKLAIFGIQRLSGTDDISTYPINYFMCLTFLYQVKLSF